MSTGQRNWLLGATAIASGCGLAAELLLGTLASYLVGNQALAYRVAVGGFLAAMGIGAHLSRFIATEGDRKYQQEKLLTSFAQIELLIAPLTAFLPLGLFALFVADSALWLGLFLVTLILGTLAGLEIPLLTRIIEQDKGVHPAMSVSPSPRRVLLLGAGDGLALREVLKWPEVERVLLIDLDQAVVNIARRHPFLIRINAHAFEDPRAEVKFADAFLAAPALAETFDVIIADFPDPDVEVLAKLYSEGFYQRLMPRLAPNGILITQASSPFFAPRAFACIAETLPAANFAVKLYTMNVPSFGPWGFVLAWRQSQPNPPNFEQLKLPVATRFLTDATLAIQVESVEINRLSDPVIVRCTWRSPLGFILRW